MIDIGAEAALAYAQEYIVPLTFTLAVATAGIVGAVVCKCRSGNPPPEKQLAVVEPPPKDEKQPAVVNPPAVVQAPAAQPAVEDLPAVVQAPAAQPAVANLPAVELQITLQRQERPNWCWLAVAVATANFISKAPHKWTQLALARKAYYKPGSNRQPSDKDLRGADEYDKPGKLSVSMGPKGTNNFGNTTRLDVTTPNGQAQALAMIKQSVDAGLPLIGGWNYAVPEAPSEIREKMLKHYEKQKKIQLQDEVAINKAIAEINSTTHAMLVVGYQANAAGEIQKVSIIDPNPNINGLETKPLDAQAFFAYQERARLTSLTTTKPP